MTEVYRPLTPQTLSDRLRDTAAVADRVGGDPDDWTVEEVGDGNLNLVFIVRGAVGTVIVKQALPYVRLVGDSWPLSPRRAFFEYQALTRQAERDPGRVPEVLHFDETQALLVMDYLTPHTILRGRLIRGERTEALGAALGRFCARTAFLGSDLALPTATRKADAAMFLDNVELCAITEGLVFTDPYFAAEMNNHTPGLDPVVATLRADVAMKTEVQHLLVAFANHAETLCHGDLHTGSVMCTETETRCIDPEFALYGPFGFDLGMLVANFLMAYFSQPAHRGDDLVEYQAWILSTIEELMRTFCAEFERLWDSRRSGILYPRALFEDQGQTSDGARDALIARIVADAFGFCGIEMHRRCLSLAHNADFEQIEDPAVRAPLEARNLMMGRELILRRREIGSPQALTALARQFDREAVR